MKKLFILFVASILAVSVIAQNTCQNPELIGSLPYSQSGLSTNGSGNEYNSDDACGSDAMACQDYVFAFTPGSDMVIRVSLQNTAVTSDIPFGVTANIGLFFLDGCPDNPVTTCVASEDGMQANPELDMISLTGGVTYYIVVSSEMYVVFIQEFETYVAFDILVEQIFTTDAATISINPIASGCDLNQASITATFKNTGLVAITGIDLSYQVGSSSAVTETYSTSIAVGAELEFTFTTPADISAIGTHPIKVFCNLTGDEYADNNYKIINVTNTPLISSFPHTADFESDNGYFYAEGTNSSWQHGTPDLSNPELVINTAASGENIWATNLAGNTNTGEISYLLSPCFDVSSLLTPTLRVNIWAEPGIMAGFGGTATLEASVDGGSNYTITVATWTASTGGWVENEFELADLIGETNIRFRFSYESGFMASEGIAIDDFTVKDEILKDIAPGLLTLPVGACGLSDSEYVKLHIINNGALPQSNIPITYSLDGGITWLDDTETIVGPIPPHDSVGFTFSELADLSIPGSYLLVVKTMLPDDEEVENNEKTFEIINTLVVNEIPYAESFETEDHSWVGSAGSSWARGIPLETLVINHAYDGQYVMGTNPEGNTNINEVSELVSPCFDFTSVTGVRLSMKVWYETGFMPATIDLQGSVDGGSEWFTIEQGWTGSSGGWITKSYYIPEFSGLSGCKVRVVYTGQMLPSEGIAIDDVRFDPVFPKDLGVSSLVAPTNSCSLGSTEHFTVEISNYGTAAQSGFQVQYSMNGGSTWTSQNYTASLPAQANAEFTFNLTSVNLSAEGDYNVIFRTQITGDQNTDNDEFEAEIVHTQSIGTYPYEESFEASDGGWFTYGTSSSFELGEPAGTIINSASQGVNAWVTNLDGNHNPNEVSYLQGPCFDFSSMVNPTIKAAVIYETSMFMAGFYVEYSIDNGMSWDTVPAGGSMGTWYGASIIPGFGSTWSGSSAGWVQVSTNMPSLAGYNNVNLRFAFNSGSFSFTQTEGVGIDEIRIYDCTALPEASFEYETNGLDVQFTSTITDADSISWNFGDNEFLPSTSSEPNPSFSYLQEGTYMVTLTVANDCGSYSFQSYIDVTTGLNNNQTQKLALYPNPAKSYFTVVSADNIISVSITTLQGKTLNVINGNGKSLQIPVDNLNTGLYLIKIATGGNTFVKTLIVE